MRSFNLPVIMALAARVAAAEPADHPPPDPVPQDQVSGVVVDDDDSSAGREVGRVALFPIRVTTAIVVAPFRGAAWAFERYQLRERLEQLFLSDDQTYGIYPTAFAETGLGFNVGAHAFDKNLFGHGEHLTLEAGFGGEFKQRYAAAFTTGPLLGGTKLGVSYSYRAWDRSNFFGIGNGDQISATMSPAPLGEAVHTRFAQDAQHVELTSTTPIMGPLKAGIVGAYTDRTFNTGADLEGYAPILSVYDPMSLVGFQHGAENFYGEANLVLDTRSVANRYISRAATSSGWYGRAAVGFAQGVNGDPSHYARYTADLRRYFNLFNGDRVLVARAYLEGVTAPIDAIPFTDLPRLGGADLLRGFAEDRFRDRVAALGSLEYDFPLQSWVGAYTFVDAGRVANDIGSLDPNGVHVGYGGGLEIHTHDAFLIRLQAAHSTDGTFLRLALDPTYDTHTDQRRL